MKVFLVGATGFVGRELLRQLVEHGILVRCLVRPGSESTLPILSGVDIHFGDASNPDCLAEALRGCQAVINLVGIIREFPARGITFEKMHVSVTENLVAAAQKQKVKRFLQMSANGTRSDAVTGYHRTKWQAEEIVRNSSLDWTIFRPSLVFGPNDHFVNMLADLVGTLPLVPVMGNGTYRMQPVSVELVARSFVLALSRPDSISQIFHCGGPKAYSYDQILDMIGKALGKTTVCKVHQPLFFMRPLVGLLEGLPIFPITSGQLQMLLEENVCDPQAWQQFFELKQPTFEEGITSYVKKK